MIYALPNRYLKYFIIAYTAIVLLSANSAVALISNESSLIEGAKLCTSYLPRHERQYGIPVHLLAAIASTESGRYNKEIGLNLPWPWTINVEGKGYFYDTKEAAVAAVREFQRRGYQSIDVGCMQVNLHHHPNAFTNLEQAFDPAYNIAYAAQFLKRNYEDEGSWRKATADYHSHTPYFGEQYARLVFSSWSRIINKVADARAGRLIPNTGLASIDSGSSRPDFAKKPYRHTYHALRMHKISVSRDTSKESGVLVIRPTHESDSFGQQASIDDRFVTNNMKPEQKKAAPAQEKLTASVNTGAQVVRLQDGADKARKGQFTPDPHIMRVGSSSEPAKPARQSNIFVFDN